MAANAGLLRQGIDRVVVGKSRYTTVFGAGFVFAGVSAPQVGEGGGGFGPLLSAGGTRGKQRSVAGLTFWRREEQTQAEAKAKASGGDRSPWRNANACRDRPGMMQTIDDSRPRRMMDSWSSFEASYRHAARGKG